MIQMLPVQRILVTQIILLVCAKKDFLAAELFAKISTSVYQMKVTALQMPPVRTQLAPTNANAILGSEGTDTSAKIPMNARAENILVANMHHV